MSTISKTKHWTGANRLSDWPERLSQFIADNAETEFVWGASDCSQFCIQAEQAMYGNTRWEDMIGGYKTQRGALGKIKKKADSLWQLIDQRMERLPSVKMAQRGDWVGHYTDDGESLGILMDGHLVCVHLDRGLVFLPMSDAVVAWRG